MSPVAEECRFGVLFAPTEQLNGEKSDRWKQVSVFY